MAEEAPQSTGAIARIVLLFMLLPATFAFERMAYYGMRAMLFLHMSSELGMPTADASRVYTVTAGVGIVTVLVGGALCIVLRPSLVVAAGALLGIVAYVLLAASGSTASLWFALLILSLGQGLFKPAVLAHAARELPHPRFHLRAALFVSLYSAINSAALMGSSSSGALAAVRGTGVSFVLSIVLASIGLVVALGAGGVDLFVKPNTPPSSPLRAGKVAIGAAVLVVALLPYHMAMSAESAMEFSVLRAAGASSYGMLQTLNPVVVMGTCFLLFATFLALHFTKVRDLTLYGVGIGVTILALAAAPTMIAAVSGSSLGDLSWLVGLSIVGMAVGEAIAGPLAMSRVVGDLPPRFTGLAAGVWLATSAGAGWLSSLVGSVAPAANKIVLALSVVACLVVGIALVALTGYLKRNLYEPASGAE